MAIVVVTRNYQVTLSKDIRKESNIQIGERMKERIEDGKTGLLVENSPLNLAEKIIFLLNDSSLRRSLGNLAAERSKEFTWEKSVKKHVELYENLTQGKHI